MIHSLVVRHSTYSRAAIMLLASVAFALILGVNLASFAAQIVPSAACSVAQPVVVVYEPAAGALGMTAFEKEVRLKARGKHVVSRLRYAPTVHGTADGGRYVARW